MCLIAAASPVILFIEFHSRLDEQLPFPTDLANDNYAVTDGCMICSVPRSCLVHTLVRLGNEGGGWFNCDHVMIRSCSACLLTNNIKRLTEQEQLPAFCFVRYSAEEVLIG